MAIARRTLAIGLGLAATGVAAVFAACSDSYSVPHPQGGGGTTTTSTTSSTTGSGGTITITGSGGSCDNTCSNDLQHVIDCHGVVVQDCPPDQGCASGDCIDDPCKAAEESKSSYGCDYYALKTVQRPQADGACFAAFVANTWGKPVHIQVERDGIALDPSKFAILASALPNKTLYDATAGLAVGEVAILFLSRLQEGALLNCPVTAAIEEETGVPIDLNGNNGNGIGKAFHITTDYPVVVYQMTPYRGGTGAYPSATLLLPTSAWDINYIAIDAYESAAPAKPAANPSLDIVAYQDNTEVTLLPKKNILGTPDGGAPAASPANTPVTYVIHKGEFLQLTQPEELTGSVIKASVPVGVFGASACMQVPKDQSQCDSAQQQLPPVRAMGSEYVAVRYRGRGAALDGGAGVGFDEPVPWRLVGAVNGTALTWEPSAPPGAPSTLALGEMVEFAATGPFVVKSQGATNPFYLGAYMTGGGASTNNPVGFAGEGDPEWVNVITPAQYLNHYVFFTDPSYPETNLVVVRTPSLLDSTFVDVTLRCAGSGTPVTLTGWQPVGSYEWTRIDLVTGDVGQNGCSNGRQEMQSALPFGVTVWGWGATQDTLYASYGYPAGAGFTPINKVEVPPIPR